MALGRSLLPLTSSPLTFFPSPPFYLIFSSLSHPTPFTFPSFPPYLPFPSFPFPSPSLPCPFTSSPLPLPSPPLSFRPFSLPFPFLPFILSSLPCPFPTHPFPFLSFPSLSPFNRAVRVSKRVLPVLWRLGSLLRFSSNCVACFCCVGFSFFGTKPRDWLGRENVSETNYSVSGGM